MRNSKKGVVQHLKVFKQLNRKHDKTSNDLKCKACGQLFISNNESVSDSNKEIWSKNWIIGKDTFDKISLESGYSKSTLQRYFSKMFLRAPILEFSSTDEIYLVLDGTYFPNDIC